MTIEYTHPRRLPRVVREDLNPEDQMVWDQIVATRGGVWGPYSALMHLPDLSERVAAVGEYLRWRGVLKGSERELAILCAAREGDSQFEWVVHEPVALKEGTRKEIIEHLKTGAQCTPTAREETIVKMIGSLIRDRQIPEPLYKSLEKLFSKEEIIELVTIAGFYQMLAFVIAGFDVPPPGTDLDTF